MKTLFEISKSGLAAAQRSLSVTSNNIVNANTDGYTRQRVEYSSRGMMSGNQSVGLGVNISTANRLRNDMNDELTNQKRQDLSSMSYRNEIFERLQAAMTTDSGGDLDTRISELFDMFSELATDPQDLSVRNSLLSEAEQLTAKFRNIDDTIINTSELVLDSTQTTLEEVNTLLKDIYSLNKAILGSSNVGDMDSTSLDLRVQKLNELSELVNFEQVTTDSGEIELRIGGVRILDSETVEPLRLEVNGTDQDVNLRLQNGKLLEVTGGELGGEIDMYSTELPDLRASLDLIAKTIVEEINAIHVSGYGLSDNVSRNFFDPTGITAGTIQINSIITNDARNIAASSVEGEAGNGEIAAQIADIRNTGVIEGRKLVDYTIGVISKPGAEINSLNAQIETKEAEIAMLETQQQREAGVNIDEELAQMIQFQNAYQASARVLTAAQTMYDTLLGVVN